MKHPLSSIKTFAAAQGLLGREPVHRAHVEEALALFGKTVDADRMSLFKLSAESTLLEPVAQWAARGNARRENTPLLVDSLEGLDTGIDNALAEPIYDGPVFVGMLMAETSGLSNTAESECKEFLRSAAVMLAPYVDTEIDEASPPKLHRPEEGQTTASSEELHVLIVEDDDANLFMIQKFIERFGAVPHSVRNGQDAVEICKKVKFDVILMDLTMPKLDGFDATREIVTGANLNRNTPIIAVTADVTTGVERRCKKLGMQHYIAKPIRRESIIRALTDLTKKEPTKN